MNSGQLCMSTDRIIIHKSLAGSFIPKYVERVKALPAGNPADPATPRRCSVTRRSRISAPRASCSRAVDSMCAGLVLSVSRLKLVDQIGSLSVCRRPLRRWR
jgi:hypothetical protein